MWSCFCAWCRMARFILNVIVFLFIFQLLTEVFILPLRIKQHCDLDKSHYGWTRTVIHFVIHHVQNGNEQMESCFLHSVELQGLVFERKYKLASALPFFAVEKECFTQVCREHSINSPQNVQIKTHSLCRTRKEAPVGKKIFESAKSQRIR